MKNFGAVTIPQISSTFHNVSLNNPPAIFSCRFPTYSLDIRPITMTTRQRASAGTRKYSPNAWGRAWQINGDINFRTPASEYYLHDQNISINHY